MMARQQALVRGAALSLLLASAPVVLPAASDTAPAVITSDTPEYCRKLIARITQLVSETDTPPPVTVESLSTEGERLCDEGHTRPGILRLRRALLLLEQDPPPP